jgi:creatinine amidohydrolase
MSKPVLPLDSRRTSDELAEASPQIALLPIGATEQHSHHLPCATDTMVADYICDGIAERLPVWRLPTLAISISHMHRGSAGSVWVTNDTLSRIVKDIVLSVRYQGIRKVVVANFHGGNFIVRPAVQDLNRDYEDMTVILLEPQVDTSDIYEFPSPMRHAEEAETSSILAIAPELVHMDRARDETPPYTQSHLLYAPIRKLGKHGCWGTPTAATAEKGRRALKRRIDASVEFIQATFAEVDRIKVRDA